MKAIISSLLLSVALTSCNNKDKYPMPDCNAEKIDVEALFNTKNRKDDEVFIKVDKYPEKFPHHSYWEENLKTKDIVQYLGNPHDVIYRWKLNLNDTIIEFSTYDGLGNLKERFWQYTGKIKSFKKDSIPDYQYPNEIKIGKKYNFKEDCTLASVADYDAIFTFTVQDIERMMKKKNISKDRLRISQFILPQANRYYWNVSYKIGVINKDYDKYQHYELNAKDGSVIESRIDKVYTGFAIE